MTFLNLVTMMASLSKLIAPCFNSLHWSIKENKFTHYWLKGGRNSTKSSFVSIEVIIGIIEDSNANGIVYRKVSDTLRLSVLEQLKWAIEVLGVGDYFRVQYKPMQLYYKPTGQIILFRGLDDARKQKGIKLAKGYFKYIWYEELDEFENMSEIRKTTLSLVRNNEVDFNPDLAELEMSKNNFTIFYTYNPAAEPNNWVNAEIKNYRSDRVIHHSTYLDVPTHWLTKELLREATELQKTDPKRYKHEFLGEVTGVEGLVFNMFDRRKHIIKTTLPNEKVVRIIVGVDGGIKNDATSAVPLAVTNAGRVITLPVFYYSPKIKGCEPLAPSLQVALINDWWARMEKANNLQGLNTLWVFDTASADLQTEFQLKTKDATMGVPKKNILGDTKRVQNMLENGDLFFINHQHICPKTKILLNENSPLINEIEGYLWDIKKNKPADGQADHAIDALKYATYIYFYSEGGAIRWQI